MSYLFSSIRKTHFTLPHQKMLKMMSLVKEQVNTSHSKVILITRPIRQVETHRVFSLGGKKKILSSGTACKIQQYTTHTHTHIRRGRERGREDWKMKGILPFPGVNEKLVRISKKQ